MTWTQGLWAVDGNPLPGTLWRLQLQSATRSAQGIVGAGDLYVKQTAVASNQVRASNGACVIAGGEAAWQGSYYGYNVGDDLISIAATSGSPRSDMIVAKVEDPTVSGGGWSHNPLTENLLYTRVISGVSAGATAPPAGISAIPLARVDVPSSTSVITQAMIADLRQMLNPRRQRDLFAVNLAGGPYNKLNSDGSWTNWPSPANFTVTVPSWAVTAKLVCDWTQVLAKMVTGSTYGPWCRVRAQLGSTQTQYTTMDSSLYKNATDTYRDTGVLADTITVPAAYRGTAQNFQLLAQGQGGAVGTSYWQMDSSSGYVVDIEWLEAPVTV